MDLRQRSQHFDETPSAGPAGAGGESAAQRQRASRHIEAGRAAIDRALSNQSSEQYLREVQQQGGQ